MELDDNTHERIKKLANNGDKYVEQGKYDKAIRIFKEALELLPPPWSQWEAATWLSTSLGDTYFSKNDFCAAKEALYDALNTLDGQMNPFIHLRLGESLFELGEMESAKEHLLKAYMLDGRKIYRGEPKKYFDFIKQHIVLKRP